VADQHRPDQHRPDQHRPDQDTEQEHPAMTGHRPGPEPTGHPDYEPIQTADTDPPDGRPRRRRPDPLALAAGAFCLVVAALTLGGRMPGLPDIDPRWALAVAAVLVGAVMLLSSVRLRRS
jgi:hypothetical protein